MTQDEYLKLGAVGVVAFLLGRFTAPDGTTVNVVPVSDGGEGAPFPTPPVPPLPDAVGPPAEPAGDAAPGTFGDRWDDLAFDVEVYPSHADPTRISPPSGPAAPAVAEDCSIIALPVGWWDRAGTVAEEAVSAPGATRRTVVDEVIAELLTDCMGASTAAVAALRLELDRRVREMLPDVVFPPPPPPLPPVLAMNAPHRSPRGRRTRTIRRR